MLEAAVKREERQQRFLAAMTANVMNCWLKRPITAERLLGMKPTGGTIEGKKTTEIEQAKFNSLCEDRSGDPIWQKLEEASQRAERQRGEQAKSKASRMRRQKALPKPAGRH